MEDDCLHCEITTIIQRQFTDRSVTYVLNKLAEVMADVIASYPDERERFSEEAAEALGRRLEEIEAGTYKEDVPVTMPKLDS